MIVACAILFSLTERSLSHLFIFGTQKGSLIPAFHHWKSLKYYLTVSSVIFLMPLIDSLIIFAASNSASRPVCFTVCKVLTGSIVPSSPFVVLSPLLFLAPLLSAGGFVEKMSADVCTFCNGKSSVMMTSISSVK